MLRYAITDRTLYPGGELSRRETLLQQAARLAATGVDYIQLREKDLPAAVVADLAREILTILRKHSAPTKLLINSRADIAIATGADGVHLTSAPGALSPAHVRELYVRACLPTPTISLSCHTLEEVSRVASATEDSCPNLILFGPVFEKVAAAMTISGMGLELLGAACRAAASIPVLALGGITEQNTHATLAAGAAGIAAIRLFQ